jgi:hypothetical protein
LPAREPVLSIAGAPISSERAREDIAITIFDGSEPGDTGPFPSLTNGRINENPQSTVTLQIVPRGTFAKCHKVTLQAIENKQTAALLC